MHCTVSRNELRERAAAIERTHCRETLNGEFADQYDGCTVAISGSDLSKNLGGNRGTLLLIGLKIDIQLRLGSTPLNVPVWASVAGGSGRDYLAHLRDACWYGESCSRPARGLRPLFGHCGMDSCREETGRRGSVARRHRCRLMAFRPPVGSNWNGKGQRWRVVLASMLVPNGHASLRDQLERASVSVVLLLAEGAGRRSRRDKRRFYSMARGSAMEACAAVDILYLRRLASIDDCPAGEDAGRAYHPDDQQVGAEDGPVKRARLGQDAPQTAGNGHGHGHVDGRAWKDSNLPSIRQIGPLQS
jgi:hypothetical protein